MEAVFIKLLNMSITAGWLILAVAVLRLVLKKAPKWTRCVLWGLVGLRLVFPFSVESALSLIPSAQTVSPDIVYAQTPGIASGIPALNQAVNPIIAESLSPTVGASSNPIQVWTTVAGYVWLAGIAALLLYTAISYIRLRRKVYTAVQLRDNIWQSENVKSPFILGLFRPRIYLPFNMTDEDIANVLAHENAHLKRRDHLIKPLAFLLLTVYWFNPLVWLAYVLLCRDIELACDERVVKDMGNAERREYGAALLACSVSRKSIAACPLAFGEVGVKERIKTVLNYKKPAFWIIAVAVVACVVVAVCFLTNPKAYSAEIHVNGLLYTQQGENVTSLPKGSYELGMLKSVQHHTDAHPTIDFAGTNLDEKYSGNALYQSGTEANVIYLEDLSGFYIPFITVARPALSLNDVIILSSKGDALTWSDFDGYGYTETGSGLYIRVYAINAQYSLWIGGGSTEDSPMYIRLSCSPGEEYIDIRMESVADFIEAHRFSELPVTFGSADLDRDGKAERFEVSETEPGSGVYLLKVQKDDGSVLWSEEAGAAHVGWNGLFLYRGEEGAYILRYNPSMFQGEAEYHYELFTLENGVENITASRTVSFSVNPGSLPDAGKRAEMDAFAAEVNALIAKSTVLLRTTDGALVLGEVSADAYLEKFAVLDEP